MRRNFTMAGSNITGFAWYPATCYKSRIDAAQLHYGGVEYRGLRLVSGNMLQSGTLGKHSRIAARVSVRRNRP